MSHRLLAPAALVACAFVACDSPTSPPPVVALVSIGAVQVLTSIGDTAQVVGSARDASGAPVANEPLTWTSSDTAVVVARAGGIVIARGNGTATVTATAANGTSGSRQVTVAQRGVRVTIMQADTTIGCGVPLPMSAAVVDARGHAVAGIGVGWGARGAASVSETGVVDGVRPGSGSVIAATFLASSGLWLTDTVALTFIDLQPGAPTVVSTDPQEGAADVPPGYWVTVTFSEAVRPASVHTATFRIANAGGEVWADYQFPAPNVVRARLAFPAHNLRAHTVTLRGITDLAGDTLAAAVSWTFHGAADTTLWYRFTNGQPLQYDPVTLECRVGGGEGDWIYPVFRTVPLGDGWYRLTTHDFGGGQSLEAGPAGAPCRLGPTRAVAEQRWRLRPGGPTGFRFVNEALGEGYSLAVDGATPRMTPTDGGSLQSWSTGSPGPVSVDPPPFEQHSQLFFMPRPEVPIEYGRYIRRQATILLVTQVSGGGPESFSLAPPGLRWSDGRWNVFAQDSSLMPTGAAYNVMIPQAALGLRAHVHTSAPSGGAGTVLSHPLLDGKPAALLFATHVTNPASAAPGGRHRPNVALSYSAGAWRLVNLDGSPMPAGTSFNVAIVADHPAAFVHRAGSGNTVESWTRINDTRVNGRPEAVIFVMPTLSTPTGAAVVNDHPIVADYIGARWVIRNADGAPMPVGAAFHVLIGTP